VFAGLSLGGASGLAQPAQTATPVQALDLRGINISSFSSFSDQQLVAVLKILDATPTVPAGDLPTSGTFWSLKTPGPPLPTDFSGSGAWQLSDGSFLLDDTASAASDATTVAATGSTTMSAREESGPPGLPGTDSTNGYSAVTDNPIGAIPINTNLLYLQICSNVSGSIVYGALMQSTDSVYAICSTTNLFMPFSLSQVEAEVFPASTNAFTVATAGRPTLFLRAQDWTGVTQGGNSTPDWWFWEFYGTTGLNLSDNELDSQGLNTLLYDYENGIDPNIISFIFTITAVTAFAVFTNKFKTWSDLTEQSPDILIAQCVSTLGDTKTKRPVAVIDGVIHSEIEVVCVLKGSTKPGPTRMASRYWPFQGEKFLLFANYENNQFFSGYNAVEEYRVISLNRYFQTNVLSGKTLNEQIQLILTNRLNDLNGELARGQEEKRRLELSWTNAIVSTNAQPARSRQGGTSF
jgi:hypothetical protein